MLFKVYMYMYRHVLCPEGKHIHVWYRACGEQTYIHVRIQSSIQCTCTCIILYMQVIHRSRLYSTAHQRLAMQHTCTYCWTFNRYIYMYSAIAGRANKQRNYYSGPPGLGVFSVQSNRLTVPLSVGRRSLESSLIKSVSQQDQKWRGTGQRLHVSPHSAPGLRCLIIGLLDGA